MGKSTTYSTLLDKLDFELEQQKEYPDSASAERFRSLPRSESPGVINDVLKGLVKQKENAYREEIILHFYDSTLEHFPLRSGEYFYVDINESVSGDIFTVPAPIKVIESFIYPDSYSDDTQRDGVWDVLNATSVSGCDIYSPSADTIFNSDGWVADYEFRVKVIMYPDDLKNDIEAVAIVTVTLNVDLSMDITTASSIDVRRGDVVTISGANPADYDGTYRVTHKSGVNISLIPVVAVPAGVFVAGSIGFVSDNLIIGIDDGFIRLLILEIKKVAYSRKGKPMSNFEYSELITERRPEWVREKGRVNTIGTLNLAGANFGRKR